MRAAVIGAGVVGLTCATELHERGVVVEIVERSSELGSGACSWWAGGMLAPWCEGESAEEPVVRLGQEAAEWWQRHTGEVRREGTLVLAMGRDAKELDRFARLTDRFSRIDAQKLNELEPDLEGRFQRALFFPEEAHLDPRRAVLALKEGLERDGITIRFETEIDPQAAEADVVIDCRGLGARDVLTDLRGVKGEMVIIQTDRLKLHRPVRLLHPRIPLYVVPRADGQFMVGATMIESDERARVSVRSMLELLGSAYALHPTFGEAKIVEIGVDARPAFPTNLPRIRRRGRVLHVNGMYRHGFLLSPAMARMVADAVLDEHHIPEAMDENNPQR